MSYESYRRRPELARQEIAMRAFMRRQQQRQQQGAPSVAVPPFERIVDVDNLIRTWKQLAREGGEAPGPDGLRFCDLGPREVADLMRTLSRALTRQQYRPGPTRAVRTRKASGGYRTLQIASVIDRVVAKALQRALDPYFDAQFHERSFGFRPRRGTLLMLAAIERAVYGQNRTVLVQDDVRTAFDSVPFADVMADHRQRLRSIRLVRLVETVLRGPRWGIVDRGIPQGNAYSPIALNLRLHLAHDLPIDQNDVHGHPLWHRYADNLVYACQSVPEGNELIHQVDHLLETAGFALKHEDGPPIDLLSGNGFRLFGFDIHHGEDDRFHFAVGEKRWENLQEKLAKAHRSENPSREAHEVIQGWIQSMGPAFEREAELSLEGILEIAARNGFREATSPRRLLREMRRAVQRWGSIRENTGIPR